MVQVLNRADIKMFGKRLCLCRFMRSEQREFWKLAMGKHYLIQHQGPTGAARGWHLWVGDTIPLAVG